jgi:Cd2+/Zn2+-exporting ATPase
VTEITCHAKGACHIFGTDHLTVIDIGGQDTKLIVVQGGQVTDFLMNDKCSAGTGRFLEVMANTLSMRLEELCELAGKGVTGVLEGKRYAVGNAVLLAELGVSVPSATVDGTAVYVACDGAYLGHLVLRDEPKANAAESLAAVRELGVRRTVMLTGDNRESAERVGNALGIDQIHAELLPRQKVTHVEALLANGCVGFVGDGINDAPVLARADVGVAMGGIGSDAAIEAADVVIMDDDLGKIPAVMDIARSTIRISRQNIVFALLVKFSCLVLGALGIANMWIAVFADVGVAVLCILNSMRMLRK